MSWQLTTPYTGGTLDASGVYDHVQIMMVRWDHRRQSVTVILEYGTISGSDWVPGLSPADKPTSYTFSGTDYTELKSHVTNVDELTHDAVERGICEWLSTNGKLDPGLIV